MGNIFYALGIAVFLVLEFLGMTWILQYSMTSFMNHNINMYSCGALVLFLIWIGNRINQMAQPTQEDDSNGEE